MYEQVLRRGEYTKQWSGSWEEIAQQILSKRRDMIETLECCQQALGLQTKRDRWILLPLNCVEAPQPYSMV